MFVAVGGLGWLSTLPLISFMLNTFLLLAWFWLGFERPANVFAIVFIRSERAVLVCPLVLFDSLGYTLFLLFLVIRR